VGSVQAGVTIATRKLEGAQAAGVFFGTVGLAMASSGIAAGVGAGVSAAIGSTVGGIIAGVAVDTLTSAALGAAEGAGNAALVGDDPGEAAWTGAVVGGVSALVGGGIGAAGPIRFLRKHNQLLPQVMPNANAAPLTAAAAMVKPEGKYLAGVLVGAVIGGAVGGTVGSAFGGFEPEATLLNVFQGIGFGVISAGSQQVYSYRNFAKAGGNAAPIAAQKAPRIASPFVQASGIV
jgi:hypothetical protein